MGNNQRQFQVIWRTLRQIAPKGLKGNGVRHLMTLAFLISGIVASKKTNLPEIAGKTPGPSKPASREKLFQRWINNENVKYDIYYLPFVKSLIANLAHLPLAVAIDGSDVGRQCVTLMISLIYRKRSIPLIWTVIQGSKGHFPEETHLSLFKAFASLIPEGTHVIFLGDGEFDGVQLQAAVELYGWEYVCRTAKSITLNEGGVEFTFQDLIIVPGDCLSLPDLLFTLDQYGPVHAIAWWQKGYKDPIFLVTNMELASEACYWYNKRFRIETFFSDQKSRGFHLHKSHISDPERLSRLMFAACLAYIWIVYLGSFSIQHEWYKVVHRTDRCDLSLFTLGLRTLHYFLENSVPIPVSFVLLPQLH